MISDDSPPDAIDELDVLATTLDLCREEAAALLDACRWADHASAVRTYGYPKDNALPPPMAQRLSDPRWLEDALEIAEEDAPAEALEALRRRLREVGDG